MNSMPIAPAFDLRRSEAIPCVDDGPSPSSVFLPEGTIPAGDYAPGFVLPRWDKGAFGSVELLGTPSVLHFYSGSAGWSQQTSALAELHPKLARLGVFLIGIMAAEASVVTAHCEGASPAFPVLCDWEPRAIVSRLYGFNRERAAPVVSATFLIDARGVIRWVQAEVGDRWTSGREILGAVRAHLLRSFPVGPID